MKDFDEEIAAEDLRISQLRYTERVLNLALKVHYVHATARTVSEEDAIDDEFEALLKEGWPA